MNAPAATARRLTLPTFMVGVPAHQGAFPREAGQVADHMLISAGAMWRGGRFELMGHAVGDAMIPTSLDSAGFVVMARHGGTYPWTVREYVELAYAYDWSWWSSMDFCVEPEIAGDHATVLERVRATAAKLAEVRQVAAEIRAERIEEARAAYELRGWAGALERATKDVEDSHDQPMPILQGWNAEDYELSAELTAEVLDGDWPELVGVGSVCRRDLHGDHGLLAVLAKLDQVLPPHVRLHLFGVKGQILAHLAPFIHRIASLDSMAWDQRARWSASDERRELRAQGLSKAEALAAVPNTVARRIGFMRAWMATQDLAMAALTTALADAQAVLDAEARAAYHAHLDAELDRLDAEIAADLDELEAERAAAPLALPALSPALPALSLAPLHQVTLAPPALSLAPAGAVDALLAGGGGWDRGPPGAPALP